MIYTDGFLDDAAAVWSDRIKHHLTEALHALEAFPEIGSPDVGASMRERFGPGVRKMVVQPFTLVYEYRRESDAVMLYGLVPNRRIR